jgi:pimeloyl-ACP methyl ester carboxylesterase
MRCSAAGALLVAALLPCMGCAPPSPRGAQDAAQAVVARPFAFADGGTTRYFELRRSLGEASGGPESWVFVFPGSGCASMEPHLPGYFRGLEGESGPLRILVLEKRHSSVRESARCDDRFVRDDHPRRWIDDYAEFVTRRLADAKPGRVVLVGISEGGEVVPLLARRLRQVTHVVLLASPGADPLESYRVQGEKHGISGVGEVLRAIAGPPPPNPDAPSAQLGGRSYRYWSELPELRTRESLLALDVPVLIGMGEADAMVPAELALGTREAHVRSGRGNLTLLTFPDADHGLVDRNDGRPRLPDFWHRVDLWLSR